MTSSVTRAGAVATIGCLALLAPLLGWATAVLFGVVAIGALLVPHESRLFSLMAAPADAEAARLNHVAGFALAVTALALLATVEGFGLSTAVFVMTVLLLVGGNVVEMVTRTRITNAWIEMLSFLAGGTLAGILGYVVMEFLAPHAGIYPASTVVAFAIIGTLIAALSRLEWSRRDEPITLFSVAIVLWLLSALQLELTITVVGVGIAITGGLGIAAYLTETASIPGMVAGVLLGFLTIVLGGFAWFALLFAFFAVGGLATKYRYEEKARHGVAEDNDGARGSANVLSNSSVALIAVLGYAAATDISEMLSTLFAIAFAGAVATALADTLSSEIGSLFGGTRLITTFEQVPPGTNGGVTVQGGIAGLAGAGIVTGLGVAFVPELLPWMAPIVITAGVAGMFADSLFGATIEGSVITNGGVNFLGTLAGALVATGCYVLIVSIG